MTDGDGMISDGLAKHTDGGSAEFVCMPIAGTDVREWEWGWEGEMRSPGDVIPLHHAAHVFCVQLLRRIRLDRVFIFVWKMMKAVSKSVPACENGSVPARASFLPGKKERL
jgi:hypothetical protein